MNNDSKIQPVDIPEYDKVPRWLILQGEIDSRIFILDKMRENNFKRPPISRMVDEATGYDKNIIEDANEIIAELRWLKTEYEKEQ